MSGVLHLVGAATSAGARGPGQEQAPAVLRRHGLVDRLRTAGLAVRDHGDVVRYRMRPDPDHPRLRSADRVVEAARTVSATVESLLADGAPHRGGAARHPGRSLGVLARVVQGLMAHPRARAHHVRDQPGPAVGPR